MPKRPGKQCNHPSCSAKVNNGAYCKKHFVNKSLYHDRFRASSSKRGYDGGWGKRRIVFLKSHPLCKSCLSSGIITAANVVDHIVPHRGDKTLFDDQDNLQSLCKPCHDAKTGSGK